MILLYVSRILEPTDFIIALLLGILIYYTFNYIKQQRYKGTNFEAYFMPALVAKLIGAFLTALMYQYYYGYGDTFWYYSGVRDIVDAFYNKGPDIALEMILKSKNNLSEEAYYAISLDFVFNNYSMSLVPKIGSILSIPTFGSFLAASFGITLISFGGSWMLYRVFVDLYPHLHRNLAIAILFVPSLCFWGTGLMKDPLSLGGVGMLIYGVYFTLYAPKKRNLFRSILILITGIFLSINVKFYVALAAVPAVALWLSLMYKNKIQNKFLRQLSLPFLLIGGVLFGFFALIQISKNISIEDLALEAAKTQWWIAYSTQRDGGTGYTLSSMDGSLGSLIRVMPEAINVSLFRPYLWEARKIVVIPSAIESFFTLILTFFVFYKKGIWGTFKAIANNPTVIFCLTFAIVFAFAVGFTSMNFGALARYKIPLLPFYFTAMVLLLDNVNTQMKLDPKDINKELQRNIRQ
jgi:hypothetical protein